MVVGLVMIMAAALLLLALRSPAGHGALQARQSDADALRLSEAGAIALEVGEEPATVRHLPPLSDTGGIGRTSVVRPFEGRSTWDSE